MPAVLAAPDAALNTKNKRKKGSPTKEVVFKSRNKNIYLEDDAPELRGRTKKVLN